MTTFIEYFSYPFFIRAFFVAILMSLLLSWFSSYIVLRKEVLFTHALSNMGFLGIALAILLNIPITPMLILVCILSAILIRVLQERGLFSNDSLLAIFSQLGLAVAIIVIYLFPGYRVNVEQYLFGDVLAVTNSDLYVSISLFLFVSVFVYFFHKNFLRLSLSNVLSHSIIKNKRLFNLIFTLLLALIIAMSMKIVGVLLVAAFTTISSNFAKIFARNIKQTFILSVFVGLISTFFGFYFSVIFDLPSGPLIVTFLGAFWLLAVIYDFVKK